MKLIKLTLLSLGLCSLNALAQMRAQSGYGEAGCGLGSMIFGSQKGGVQILAATTNGSSGSQTFGMTSGTSNCSAVFGKSTVDFIEANKVSLTNDSARGQGESLNALSQLYGCDEETEFAGTLQKNFADVFNSEDSVVIDQKIKSLLKNTKLSCDLV